MRKLTSGANGGNAGLREDGGGDAGWPNGGEGEDTSVIKGCDGRCKEGNGVCMGGRGDPGGAAKTVKTNWIVKVCR